jgi:polyhydroxyalkanoate synthesis regulator protein
MTEAGTPLTIKRYAGKHVYNPAAGAYLTLDDLARRIGDDADFTVTLSS